MRRSIKINLVKWFIERYIIILDKLINDKPLTYKEEELFNILKDFKHWAPKNLQ